MPDERRDQCGPSKRYAGRSQLAIRWRGGQATHRHDLLAKPLAVPSRLVKFVLSLAVLRVGNRAGPAPSGEPKQLGVTKGSRCDQLRFFKYMAQPVPEEISSLR